MLELRYNGCSKCLETAKTIMSAIGYFPGRDYKVTYHDEHRADEIYKVRPDYIDIFSGAILYNPDSKHWLDFYSRDHSKCVLPVRTGEDKELVTKLVTELLRGL